MKMKRNFTFTKFRICRGKIDNFLQTKFNKTFGFEDNKNFFEKIKKKVKII